MGTRNSKGGERLQTAAADLTPYLGEWNARAALTTYLGAGGKSECGAGLLKGHERRRRKKLPGGHEPETVD